MIYIQSNIKYRCLRNTNAPFPNWSRIGLTFDLDLEPTDLNIDRGHLLIKDYLPTKFEACRAKRSWVISYTRWSTLAWPLTLAFDLLTWIYIEIIYLSRTIYLPSLKLLGQSVLELSVAQGEVDWHDLWLWPTDLNINRDHLLIKDYLPYQVWSFWGEGFLSYQLHKVKGDRHTDGHVQGNMPLLLQREA